MIAEVIKRRYKYAMKGEELWPDLVLIDGGLGQLHAAEAEPGFKIARAQGASSVLVAIPRAELADPTSFIARVLDLTVLLPNQKALIILNSRAGTIFITGNVQIDPVVFSIRGLTVDTLNPPIPPTLATPELKTKRFQMFAPNPRKITVGARQLVEAFDLLQVPVEDQMNAIRQLKLTGRLHAKVVEN